VNPRRRGVLALGWFQARRGITAVVAAALTVVAVLGFGVLAFVVLARHGQADAVASVPLLASSALAFGVGVLVAFGVSTHAFGRDENEGIRTLLRARGVDVSEYMAGRVAGLALLLAVLVAGGSGLVGLLATLAARSRETALHTLQASMAAVVFGVLFAVTFAPVAMAALGARSRGGGYLVLLAVLVLPELVAPRLDRFVSQEWLHVCSIPGALLAVRTALAPVGIDAFMLMRGLLALAVIVALALLVVRAELARSHAVRRGA
jgi:hypothetical protein